MKTLRALRIRLYPNKEQETQILKTLGCCRFIYNVMLAERIEVYDKLKDDRRALYEYGYKTEKQYKNEYTWLKEVDSQALQQARIDLSVAYQNFFRRVKNGDKEKGFPKFKRKHDKNSYRTPIVNGNIKIDFYKKKLKLPKMAPLSFRGSRVIEDIKIHNVTITRSKTGKYFASILYEKEISIPQDQKTKDLKVKGLDMSLTNFFVDDEGNSPVYDKIYAKYEDKIGNLQKIRAKKKKDSCSYRKLSLKINRIYEYLTNYRKNYIEQLSTQLTRENDIVVVENLSLKDMAKFKTWEERKSLKNKGNYGKAIYDLGWAMFLARLKTKAVEQNKKIIEADKWFASSQICCICGYQNKEIKDLSIREWLCPICNTSHLRDQNAAINLKNIGLFAVGTTV